MKVVLSGPFRSLSKSVVFVAFLAGLSSVHAEPSQETVAFEKSTYPKIHVRQVPVPAQDKVRQVPPAGTPRTTLPVLQAKTPKGGKLLRVDNTYLVQCPPPRVGRASTNAVVEHAH